MARSKTRSAILGLLLAAVAFTPAGVAQDAPGAGAAQDAPGAGAGREVLLDWIGQRLFFDTRMSEPAGVACASCHEPARAFTGDNGSNGVVARGSRHGVLGNRNVPTLMYLAATPPFGFVERDGKRVPVGGFFWDGRAATLADQAKQPLLNPLEMNNTDAAAVAAKASSADYAPLMRRAFGADVFADPQRALDAVAEALASFQRGRTFAPFSSKFDFVLRRQARLTEQEERGFGLFTIRQKGNCAECHTVDRDNPDPAASLFTNFGYHALGVARETRVARNADAGFHDLGVCGPFRESAPDGRRWCGYFKVPTLRNVAVTGPYMHNGRFASLRDAVAFYATRDTEPARWYPGAKFDDLPADLRGNVDVDTPPYHRIPGRRPALNDDEVDDIVVFLHTLTDGWRPQ